LSWLSHRHVKSYVMYELFCARRRLGLESEATAESVLLA